MNTTEPSLQFATWNINSLTVRLPQLIDWLAAHPVDVIALQETKITDDKFPQAELLEAGWRAHFLGQKTYNGVALLTRATNPLSEPQDVVLNIPGFSDEQARVITATIQGIRVIGAYFPNGQAPGTEKFAYKMSWLRALHQWVESQLKTYPQLILMGDFNIAPQDQDVYDPIAWAGQIHCTTEEREQFQALINLGMHDSFRLFDQPERSWSWWDYRNLAFRKNQGLRIDHILISQTLRPRAMACTIDKTPRRNERPSDHAPVILTLKAA